MQAKDPGDLGSCSVVGSVWEGSESEGYVLAGPSLAEGLCKSAVSSPRISGGDEIPPYRADVASEVVYNGGRELAESVVCDKRWQILVFVVILMLGRNEQDLPTPV